ncbi:MAG: TauD/TfdA family dioxygenase [Planctomycetaceae bacterium]|nr:TauD/TfdA family dioxygenase [Planctomycetaceae bacterium]
MYPQTDAHLVGPLKPEKRRRRSTKNYSMLRSKRAAADSEANKQPINACRSNEFVLEIVVDSEQEALIEQRMKAATTANRFVPDTHAAEMKAIGGEILKASLKARDIQKLRQFGRARTSPVLFISGLPEIGEIPSSPFRGYNLDQSQVAFADMLLLGVYDVAGIDPVAYTYENFAQLFRNVVASPDAVNERSSHGSKEPLGWHTDNPCGRFEGDDRMLAVAHGSPIPRYLAFTPLRNRDASGKPVPTEVLVIDAALARLDEISFAVLTEHEFQVNPPASNKTAPLSEVPLLVRRGGRYLIRFNADAEQVFGLTERAQKALDAFKVAIHESADDVLEFSLEPSRLLIFDNYRVMHKRRSFDMGSDWAAARWLRRCYGCMSLMNGVFADRVHQPYVWA